MFVIQLLTFRLLTSLSLVSEITPGLCSEITEVNSSGCATLCMVLDGLVRRGPEDVGLLVWGSHFSDRWNSEVRVPPCLVKSGGRLG